MRFCTSIFVLIFRRLSGCPGEFISGFIFDYISCFVRDLQFRSGKFGHSVCRIYLADLDFMLSQFIRYNDLTAIFAANNIISCECIRKSKNRRSRIQFISCRCLNLNQLIFVFFSKDPPFFMVMSLQNSFSGSICCNRHNVIVFIQHILRLSINKTLKFKCSTCQSFCIIIFFYFINCNLIVVKITASLRRNINASSYTPGITIYSCFIYVFNLTLSCPLCFICDHCLCCIWNSKMNTIFTENSLNLVNIHIRTCRGFRMNLYLIRIYCFHIGHDVFDCKHF